MSKLTKAAIAAALRAAEGQVYEAARQLGCSPQAIYKRLAADPYLRRVRRQAEAAAQPPLQTKPDELRQRIEAGDVRAIISVLRRYGKYRGYAERTPPWLRR